MDSFGFPANKWRVNLQTFNAKKSDELQLSVAKAKKHVQPVCIYATCITSGNISYTDTAANVGRIIAVRDTWLLSSGQNM